MEDKVKSTVTHEAEYRKKIETLSEKLDKQKKEFFNNVQDLILSSSDFDRIPDIQVQMLSQRHRLLDYMTNDLNKALVSSKTLYEKGRKNSLIQMKTNYDVRLTSDREKTIIGDADTRVFKEMIELIDAQIYFVKETIKLLDNLAYSIRNRVDIYKFQHGE